MTTTSTPSLTTPIRVCVTGAAGQIAYSLLPHLASGGVFGQGQAVSLLLLDIPPAVDALKGVVMELEDCAFPLLAEIVGTTDPMEAFRDVDVAFLVGAMPRKQGMQRKDLLKANASIFKAQGQALDKVAKKNVKVCVVGNPANTNAFITKHYAPSIPAENFTALTRLDENRSKGMISKRLNVPVDQIKNMIIWGNHSATQYPDFRHAYVQDFPTKGKQTPVAEAVNDLAFLQGPFCKDVQTRGAAVIKARKLSSALSAAKAIADHMRDWWLGTKPGEYVCMGVSSDGSYGIPKGIVFSFPLECKAGGTWSIIPNLPGVTVDANGSQEDAFATEKLQTTLQELKEEREEAMLFLDAAPTTTSA